ncbi:MAG: hypothetical protein HC902_07475 [Calothrix sp. SM1_5_4]|nr:hypothetical protein [Calothrix sp. SM1_5_4]
MSSRRREPVRAGQIGFSAGIAVEGAPRLRQLPGYRQISALATYYYGFNTRKPPFDNVKVRKAFVHALDRKQITDLLSAGHAPCRAGFRRACSAMRTSAA